MSSQEHIKICPYCFKKFKTTIQNQVYCCDSHRFYANNMKWRSGKGRENVSDYQKRYIKKIRDEVYRIFGAKCARCGIDDPDVLSIDHLEPVGKKQKTNY